jgi:AraC-like DNA-binding protein
MSESRFNATKSCELETRTRILDLPVGFVEDLRRSGVRPGKGQEFVTSAFQVSLPYNGMFVYHVGGDDVVGDSNQLMFCRPGESFRITGPIPEGYSVMIVNPRPDLLEEVLHVPGQSMVNHPLVRRRSRLIDSRLQQYRAHLRHWASTASEVDVFAAEELVITLVQAAFRQDTRPYCRPGTAVQRLIRRTKEFLAAEFSQRVRLIDVARAVHVSPAYLTDVFRRVEGLPVHRYLTRLRLARALVDLPHTSDLTALAIDLGFSSHSHFSFAFRRAFGITPSQFRERARRMPAPELLRP